jgi:outer membrane protein assembly factor BamB
MLVPLLLPLAGSGLPALPCANQSIIDALPISKSAILFLMVMLGLSAQAPAADWPNWRGPDHNGISTETGWTAQWAADGPKQLWKTSVGTGFSSITVANGRAYTVGNRNDTDTIYCFDAETGSNLWKHSYACAADPNMYEGGPSATPTVDGDRVYSVSKKGTVFCLGAADGKMVWSKNVADEVGAAAPGWGFAGSALVRDNLLILDIGGRGAAVDKNTGKVVWASDKEVGGYSTPVPCSFNGAPAVIIVSKDTVFGVETKSGRRLWSFPWKTEYDLNIADAIVSGNDVFVSSGYDHGASVHRVNGVTVRPVWENSNLRNHIDSSVLVGGYLYGVDGAVNDSGAATLKCLDFATGNEKWNFPGLGGGALMVADHKIITLSDKGELVVAEASPQGFNPISRVQVLGGKCWTVPTLANGRIYCRNAKGDLLCLDVKSN